MNKKNNLALIVVLTFVTLSLGALGLENYQGQVNMAFTPQTINITSPQNITYNFSTKEEARIILNATSHFLLKEWSYTLENLRKDTSVTVMFQPSFNLSVYQEINVTNGQNKLTVFGEDINGDTHEQSVYFLVVLPNTAPIIENISNELFVCENSYIKYYFSSYDEDADLLTPDITPKSPFYITPFTRIGVTRLISEIYSGTLRKNRVGIYEETVSISDGQNSDSRIINITVIEVNNAPVIGNIGVQTIWLVGENSAFNRTLFIIDTENGQDPANFSLNISFSNRTLFNLSQNGEMYFEANETDIGVYNITICARDNAIANIHPNISLCTQNGTNITTCLNFSLTVTNVNRPPTITSYWPINTNLTISGTSTTQFNISKYDPDFTIPDSYWYIDGRQINYFSGQTNDSLSYSFECGITGAHEMEVLITDGALNDSLSWNLNVSENECPVEKPTEAGGGGGGGAASCTQKIACEEWFTCQNSKKSLEIGILSGENYREIKDLCDAKDYNENTCGFQLRACYDLNNCSKIISNSEIIGECYFTLNPSCSDGIQNCHDKSCETLVDCGGSCSPCATCSDKIQNQGENGADCGGPCPLNCKSETKSTIQFPFLSENFVKILKAKQTWILLIIILLIALIIYISRRIYIIKREKKRIVYRYFRNKYE